MMDPNQLVYPMFAMLLLTAGVLVTLFVNRVRAVREGKISTGYFKIYQREVEPEYSAKPARHFANLFETPILFYVGCLAAMLVRPVGLAVPILAWTYVLLRFVHAWVHLGSNRLRPRMTVYFLSWLVLLAMWIFVVAAVAIRN
jgi:hypothetical protein